MQVSYSPADIKVYLDLSYTYADSAHFAFTRAGERDTVGCFSASKQAYIRTQLASWGQLASSLENADPYNIDPGFSREIVPPNIYKRIYG